MIGSGPIVIGQAAEFDYAGTQACLALKEEGIRVILANNNPATIMTDEEVADVLYMEPLTADVLSKIIEQERPQGLLATMGGQTGLNLAMELTEQGILQQYGVELLGTPVETIRKGEDREAFKVMMEEIGEPVPKGRTVDSVKDALRCAAEIGYPVVIRPAYTLGGFGGGTAEDQESLAQIVRQGLAASPIQQVLIEQSILGWKELEYEMMRDAFGTCIAVCNMENIDPVGTHTGDSIVTAPSQTLTDRQYQLLRSVAIKVIQELKVVGGCNIQVALHPETSEYAIIEVNPRVSRSSALASKATGYPIARLATKLSIGYRLDECMNPVTGHTNACFEPTLDYVAVKMPRWPFDQFPEANRRLGTQMKATGEVMALGRNLETALYKAIRSLDMGRFSLLSQVEKRWTDEELTKRLEFPDDQRFFALGEAFRRSWSLEKVQRLTGISQYFLEKIGEMAALELNLAQYDWASVPYALLKKAKGMGVADAFLAGLYQVKESMLRNRWQQLKWQPSYKWVDTCAGEFKAETPYFYSSWQGEDEVAISAAARRVMVIGSGPIRIGQGIEFDYCSVHAAKSLHRHGVQSVIVNNNPETVSTDYITADRLYFEPLTVEDVVAIAFKEQIDGVLVQYGGQTAIKLIKGLEEAGCTILGTSAETIDRVEDRQRFYELLRGCGIPHIAARTASTPEEVMGLAEEIGYPILLRPSYVIGGRGMQVLRNPQQLSEWMDTGNHKLSKEIYPLLLDRYVEGIEVEVDAVTDGIDFVIPTLVQHIERAGVHSGDSLSMLATPDLQGHQREKIVAYTARLVKVLSHVGLLNIQFVVTPDDVFVLEVNPRASRTVPVISKVTGVPMVDWATRVQLGEALASFAPVGLLPPPKEWAVKGSVFSNTKLPGVDPALGPEMRSTGEVLGLGATLQEAIAKVLPWTLGTKIPPLHSETALLLSVADSQKEELTSLLPEVLRKGLTLYATPGTADWIEKKYKVKTKVLPQADWVNWFQTPGAKVIFNLPTQGGDATRGGFQLRRFAQEWQVPCFTSPDTFTWLFQTEEWRQVSTWTIQPLSTFQGKEMMNR